MIIHFAKSSPRIRPGPPAAPVAWLAIRALKRIPLAIREYAQGGRRDEICRAQPSLLAYQEESRNFDGLERAHKAPSG